MNAGHMKRIMIQLILIVISLVASGIVLAQDYVVLAKGDTLRGVVKFMSYGAEQQVQLTEPDKKKINYPVLQVKAFQLENEQYHTIRTAEQYRFMRLVKSGYLSLYSYQLDGMTWNGSWLMKKDGNGIDVPNIGFKRRISEFVFDCKEVSMAVAEGKLGRNDLLEIIDHYNTCVENRTGSAEQTEEQTKKFNAWDELEIAVSAKPEFEGRSDALEMIAEVKSKIRRSEKVPNFLTEGLTNLLKPFPDLSDRLSQAMKEIQ
jgi:hypothetical protein